MSEPSVTTQPSETAPDVNVPPVRDSYVKLAMRNMVRKKGISFKHFFLTTAGLLTFLVGISYLTR